MHEERRGPRGSLSIKEREKGGERKKGWKKRRAKDEKNELSRERTLFSLSLFFFHSPSHMYAGKKRRVRRTRSFARSETKLVAFRGTRDGADGGDGGTAGQKRITRVITTLINK